MITVPSNPYLTPPQPPTHPSHKHTHPSSPEKHLAPRVCFVFSNSPLFLGLWYCFGVRLSESGAIGPGHCLTMWSTGRWRKRGALCNLPLLYFLLRFERQTAQQAGASNSVSSHPAETLNVIYLRPFTAQKYCLYCVAQKPHI